MDYPRASESNKRRSPGYEVVKNHTCVWRNIYNTARATHSRYYKYFAKHACDFSLIPEPTARSAVRGYYFPPAIYTRGNESISGV
jgi:hypothetical protein